jgi:tetratricopeptide (TPR) repeat protein
MSFAVRTSGLAPRGERGKLWRPDRLKGGTMGSRQLFLGLLLVGALSLAAGAGRADDAQDLAFCRNNKDLDAKILTCSIFLKRPLTKEGQKKQLTAIVMDALLERAVQTAEGAAGLSEEDFEKAMRDVDEAGSLVPGSARPPMTRGIVLRARADELWHADEKDKAVRLAGEALKHLEEAARIDAKVARTWYEMAYVEHELLDRTDAAFAHGARALGVDEDYAPAHSVMGRIQRALKKDEDSVASFQRAFELNKDKALFRNQYVDAALNLAKVFRQSGRRGDAAEAVYELSEALIGSNLLAGQAYVIAELAADLNRLAIANTFIQHAIKYLDDGSLRDSKDRLEKIRNNIIAYQRIEQDWAGYLLRTQRAGTGVNWLGDPYDLYYESRASSTNE